MTLVKTAPIAIRDELQELTAASPAFKEAVQRLEAELLERAFPGSDFSYPSERPYGESSYRTTWLAAVDRNFQVAANGVLDELDQQLLHELQRLQGRGSKTRSETDGRKKRDARLRELKAQHECSGRELVDIANRDPVIRALDLSKTITVHIVKGAFRSRDR